MSIIALVFLSAAGVAFQSGVPSSAWIGHAPFPFLLGLVIHEALLGRRSRLIPTALLTGLLADALTMVPLGYSCVAYLIAGLLIRQGKDLLIARQWTTQALLGGVAHALVIVLTFLLLLVSDRPELTVAAGLARAAGGVVTGAIAVPLVFAAVMRLEQALGHMPVREAI